MRTSPCRLRAKAEGTGYPRSACNQCGWRVLQSKIETTCTDEEYSERDKEVSQAQKNVDIAVSKTAYRLKLTELVNKIIDGTGLQKHIPEHRSLIVMYALMAMHKGGETTQEDIHDAWALWTLFIRELPNHENMLPFDQLTERVKVLDKVDMMAIQDAVK